MSLLKLHCVCIFLHYIGTEVIVILYYILFTASTVPGSMGNTAAGVALPTDLRARVRVCPWLIARKQPGSSCCFSNSALSKRGGSSIGSVVSYDRA